VGTVLQVPEEATGAPNAVRPWVFDMPRRSNRAVGWECPAHALPGAPASQSLRDQFPVGDGGRRTALLKTLGAARRAGCRARLSFSAILGSHAVVIRSRPWRDGRSLPRVSAFTWTPGCRAFRPRIMSARSTPASASGWESTHDVEFRGWDCPRAGFPPYPGTPRPASMSWCSSLLSCRQCAREMNRTRQGCCEGDADGWWDMICWLEGEEDAIRRSPGGWRRPPICPNRRSRIAGSGTASNASIPGSGAPRASHFPGRPAGGVVDPGFSWGRLLA